MAQPDRFKGTFNAAQTRNLLAPIKPHRVMTANGQSHVSQQDVVAHLTRIFGFGNWMTDLVSLEPVFEQVREESKSGTFTKGQGATQTTHEKADNPQMWRYDVCYRAVLRLTIFDEYHNVVTSYEDGSMGDAQNQTRADAHDLAMKTAISTALKRCAKNLGDQFGLSLYNKGQRTALVGGTLVLPPAPAEGTVETQVQDHASEQVSMGVDETERRTEATPEQTEQLAASLGAQQVAVEEPTEADRAAVAEEPRADWGESS
jgi:hypothetical protein